MPAPAIPPDGGIEEEACQKDLLQAPTGLLPRTPCLACRAAPCSRRGLVPRSCRPSSRCHISASHARRRWGSRSSSSPTWIPAHVRSTPLEGSGGARRDRTDDLMLAKHALSQLSYGPSLGLAAQACVPCSSLKRRRRRPSPRLPRASARAAGRPCERCRVRGANPGSPSPPRIVVGLGRLERPTSPLSGVRSNHLSYRPAPAQEPRASKPRRPDHALTMERETKTAGPAKGA